MKNLKRYCHHYVARYLINAKCWLSARLDSAFAKHGAAVYDYPWHFILSFALLSAIMSIGILCRTNEYDMYKLYTYPGAQSHQVHDKLINTFVEQRANYFFIIGNDDTNILDKEMLNHIYNFVEEIKSLSVEESKQFKDLCIQDHLGKCSEMTILDIYASPKQWGKPIISKNWPLVLNMKTKRAWRLDGLLGNMKIEHFLSNKRPIIQGGGEIALNKIEGNNTSPRSTIGNDDDHTKEVKNNDTNDIKEDLVTNVIPHEETSLVNTNEEANIVNTNEEANTVNTNEETSLVNTNEEKMSTDIKEEDPSTNILYKSGDISDHIVNTMMENSKPEPSTQKHNYTGQDVLRVSKANATLLRFDLIGEGPTAELSLALEEKMIKLAQEYSIPGCEIFYRMERSISDELKRSSIMGFSETISLCAAMLTVLLYTIVVNSTLNRRTKTIPAIVGVVSTLLGHAGGAGLMYLFGVPHTPPAEATPFLVLGIGVDNAFVLLNSYCLTYLVESPRTRIINTARDAGVSITITTLTSVVALIIGAASPYLSISMFCIITSFCLAWSYVLMLTIFLGCLALDAKREHFALRHKSQIIELKDAKESSPSKALMISTKNEPSIIIGSQAHDKDQIEMTNYHLNNENHINDENTPHESCVNDSLIVDNIDKRHTEEYAVSYVESNPSKIEGSIKYDQGDSLSNQDLDCTDEQNINTEASYSSNILYALQNLSTYELASLICCKIDTLFNLHEGAESSLTPPNSIEESSRNFDNRAFDAPPAYNNMPQNTLSLRSNTEMVRLRIPEKEPRRRETNDSTESNHVLIPKDIFFSELYRYLEEPKGNVGRIYRNLLVKYYCRLLSNTWVKYIIMMAFTAMIGLAIYSIRHLENGITADEVAPNDSYLKHFFEARGTYFSSLGEEVTVFFPSGGDWGSLEVQNKLKEMNLRMTESGHAVAIYNGMDYFFQRHGNHVENVDLPTFSHYLHQWLTNDLVGHQFVSDFTFETENDQPMLKYWKFRYWMPHSLRSDELLGWLIDARNILDDGKPQYEALAYTPLGALWESDPHLVHYTLSSLFTALVAILIMTTLLIPHIKSVLVVGIVIVLVDTCLFGFMALWGLRLNLLSMVTLLLAIGYSVDSTLFMLNAFTHCCGTTRSERMEAGILLMGSPVANGMFSTLLAVLFLIGSTKFVMIVFFRMMVLVLLLSFGFGMVLLPAVLCYFGPFPKNEPVFTCVPNSLITSSNV